MKHARSPRVCQSVVPSVVDDRVHRDAGVSGVGAPASAAAAAHDLPQLVAEHPAADRVQEKVDGEAGDVQRFAVVAPASDMT